MRRTPVPLWFLANLLGFAAMTPAADFADLDVKSLKALAEDPAQPAKPSLSLAEVTGLPTLFRQSRAGFIVVRTDQGNLARVLLGVELRRSAAEGKEPFPVFVIERFETFDPSRPGARQARGRDLVLFDGFQVDLDSGMVVPPGEGGDLQHLSQGAGGPRLVPIQTARIHVPARLPQPSAAASARPTPGRVVVPRDFAGRYRLFSNGQWSGNLDLAVDPKGVATGQFRSDLHGSSYPVTGQVATDEQNKMLFSITFPRSRQEFEGYLWSEGKGAMAGTTSLLERTFGFFAIREGGLIAPDDGGDVEAPPGGTEIQIEPAKSGWVVDGKPTEEGQLESVLKTRAHADATRFRLRWSEDIRAERLTGLLGILTRSGAASIVIDPIKPKGAPK